LSNTRGGPRLWTAFAKLSPDLGDSHALQVGMSYAHNSQQQSAYVLDQPPGLVAPPVDLAGDGAGAVIAGSEWTRGRTGEGIAVATAAAITAQITSQAAKSLR